MTQSSDKNFDEQPFESPDSSSSYYDFVERKAQEDGRALENESMDLEETGRDAFVVQIPDDETAYELKLKYFP